MIYNGRSSYEYPMSRSTRNYSFIVYHLCVVVFVIKLKHFDGNVI